MGLQQLAKAMEDMPNMRGDGAWQEDAQEDAQGVRMEDRGVRQIELHCYSDGNESVILVDHVTVVTNEDAFVLGGSINGKLLISGPFGTISAHAIDENTFEMWDIPPLPRESNVPPYMPFQGGGLWEYIRRVTAQPSVYIPVITPELRNAVNRQNLYHVIMAVNAIRATAARRGQPTGGGSHNPGSYIGGSVGRIPGGGWRL